MRLKRYMVFDVESVGLHGEGFAVGYVVVDIDGNELDCGYFGCPHTRAASAPGDREGRPWIMKHVVPYLPDQTHNTPRDVRTAFWEVWVREKDLGADLVTDCGWPVEHLFLEACVMDHSPNRLWAGPYPLLDLSNLLYLFDYNPLDEFDRLPNELPGHNPLADARQSARIWCSLLRNERLPTKV